MSLWRDDTPPPREGLLLVVAVALLALLSLSRIFASSSYLVVAVPAVAIGAGFALTVGRRTLGLAFALTVAAGVFTMPVLFARQETFALLPTPASLAAVRTLLAQGLGGMMNEVAPVPPDAKYLSVLWAGGLAGGFLGASWVVVQRPLGAFATALGVLAYAGSIGRGPGRDLFGFVAVVLLGGYLLADGRHRIAAWSKAVRRVRGNVGTVTLAVASLVALAGPTLLGVDQPWLNVQGSLRPRIVVIKPLSDVRDLLDTNPPFEIMRVQASSPTYWRLTALDRYTGSEWLLEAKPERVEGTHVPPAEPPTTGAIVTQAYSITSLSSPWLPAAYAAESVEAPVPYDADTGSSTLLLPDQTGPGLRYTVTSRLPDVASPSTETAPLGKPDRQAEGFAAIARPIVQRARTPWEQAVAIQNHFRGYRYDDTVEGGHSVARLQRFLQDRAGYCEQFAATMTLMLRGLGTPARVGVGFLPGRSADGQRYVVTTKDAHAWVEANIPGMGWVRFDPTPGRGQPAGADTEQQPEAEQPTPSPGTAPAQATPPPPRADQTDLGTPERSLPRLPLVPMAVGAMVAGALPGAKAVRRRMRRSGTPAQAVFGAYAELVDRVADLGWKVRPSQTPLEAWAHAFDDGRAPGASGARELAQLTIAAVYGPSPPSAGDAERAWALVGPALRALRRSLPWWRRLFAAYDPRTFLPSGSPSAQLAAA